jgi:hypothetical protein
MFGDGGIDERFPEQLELSQRTFFVAAHQAAIAGDIRHQDCRQPPFHALTIHDAPPVRELNAHYNSLVISCPAASNVRCDSAFTSKVGKAT